MADASPSSSTSPAASCSVQVWRVVLYLEWGENGCCTFACLFADAKRRQLAYRDATMTSQHGRVRLICTTFNFGMQSLPWRHYRVNEKGKGIHHPKIWSVRYRRLEWCRQNRKARFERPLNTFDQGGRSVPLFFYLLKKITHTTKKKTCSFDQCIWVRVCREFSCRWLQASTLIFGILAWSLKYMLKTRHVQNPRHEWRGHTQLDASSVFLSCFRLERCYNIYRLHYLMGEDPIIYIFLFTRHLPLNRLSNFSTKRTVHATLKLILPLAEPGRFYQPHLQSATPNIVSHISQGFKLPWAWLENPTLKLT